MPTAAAGRLARTVHVEQCMGTAFTIDIRDAGEWGPAVEEVAAWLHHVDAVFSTYRSDSDISRIQRGELPASHADVAIADVLQLCADAYSASGGAFTAMPYGRLDPTGIVKGWAVEKASQMLRERGCRNHAINGGGDMQLAGDAAVRRGWQVGIADPWDPTRTITVVTGSDYAVATSGTSQRGAHIVSPFTARPVTQTVSATVVGASLSLADAYATAACVLGPDACSWIESIEGYECLVIAVDGKTSQSRGWRRLLPAPSAA